MLKETEQSFEMSELRLINEPYGKFFKDYNIIHPGDVRRNHTLGIVLGGLVLLLTIAACICSWW